MPPAVALARQCATGWFLACWALAATLGPSVASAGQAAPPIAGIHIARATGKIVVDGDLSDDGVEAGHAHRQVVRDQPGRQHRAAGPQRRHARYDDKFFYAAFEFDDPLAVGDPRAVSATATTCRASPTTAGVILDARNDGKTAVLMLANPRGIQYDAVTRTTAAAARLVARLLLGLRRRSINDHGWTLEIRIPFSSLRYRHLDPQTVGHHAVPQLPARLGGTRSSPRRCLRGGNCFICRSNSRSRASRACRPAGTWSCAPYGERKPDGNGRRRSRFASRHRIGRSRDAGIDVKWTSRPPTTRRRRHRATPTSHRSRPTRRRSRRTSASRSSSGEAAVLPRRRRACSRRRFRRSTRAAITDPRWGAHATGNHGSVSYTALVADDDRRRQRDSAGTERLEPGRPGLQLAGLHRPGPKATSADPSVSVLLTDRESGADGHNRVVGPDFQWRHSDSDFVTGQLLFSDTRTPNRPEASPSGRASH